jgi:hypothetical protein
VTTTPYIAIYDRMGKLAKAYDKAPSVDEMIATVQKIAPLKQNRKAKATSHHKA